MISGYYRRQALVSLRKIISIVKTDHHGKLVAELQNLLLTEWRKSTREAISEVIRLLVQPDRLDHIELDNLLRDLQIRLGTRFTNRVAAPLTEIQTNAYERGQRDIIKVKPSFNVVDRAAIDMLQRHNIYWVRDFWDSKLAGRVEKLGTQAISQGLTRRQAGELFEQAFSDQFGQYSIRYWEGFATHVITRSRELGAVEGYVKAGIEQYEIRAILDHRTTDICREMHGRVFSVEKAVAMRDALLAAKSPEEVKEIAPWMKPEDVQGKATGRLSPGLSLPPFHFKCRTRSIRHVSPAKRYQVGKTSYGNQVPGSAKKVLSGPNKSEWSNWVRDIQGNRALRFRRDELDTQFKRYGAALGISATDELTAAARKTVRQAERVLVQSDGKGKTFLFIAGDRVAAIDDAMAIRGIWPAAPNTIEKLTETSLWLQKEK